ncbi:hypothetical protein [Vibrio crassostreae]|uniref:hypothetical protein n=1 Tax=Vibrio crassostreae TaxID=246167 RepID=UPI000F49E1BF|nr:hypothetical protein [Vibrio crassostreae]ROO55599.1 hypothetical protein EDB56_102258 [Vibrio crassostreae]ROR28034.1 hypothetical protein EDB67_101509 [Vibrio crassostreae]TCO05265.1 hypothetical protein EDB51_101272 [Vibrio crassostreae]TCW08190.1 hypothetical protein EDB49_103210 [Vibrio crassostreae]CAK1850448.1 exported hypothetical protein [Vibrio crassostreae]
MFYKYLLPLALPLTFVFPTHAETFGERMTRIEQENVLAKTMSEEQVELIQKVVQTNHCAKVALTHHQRILGQYKVETSSSELFVKWRQLGKQLDAQYETDYPGYPKHAFQEYPAASSKVDGYLFALIDNGLNEQSWIAKEFKQCKKNKLISRT